MNPNDSALHEEDLHAYVDGRLDPARRREVEAYLATAPAEARRVEAYRRQNELLHSTFDHVLDEPVPARLQRPMRERARPPLLRYAAGLAGMLLCGAAGWVLHGQVDQPMPASAMGLAQQAAIAHVVYSPEVRHPVEVSADQEQHLVKWLSKRVGTELKAPHLGKVGYELLGGRLLPGSSGPAAQFMYQDARGQRLTLYVRSNAKDNRDTAFRYAKEGNVSVFYWVDGPLGYALSGELSKGQLLRVAEVVYGQINR